MCAKLGVMGGRSGRGRRGSYWNLGSQQHLWQSPMFTPQEGDDDMPWEEEAVFVSEPEHRVMGAGMGQLLRRDATEPW